jgi:hypothetical protein
VALSAAPPVLVPPAAAPAKSGTSTVKIVLIVVAIIVGLGMIGVGAFGYFVYRVAHAIKVSSSGGQITLPTPGGTITANSSENFSASDLGTDIYPGAQPGKGSMRMTLPTGSMISAVYVTSDSKDQVLAFYKSKSGSNASVIDTSSGAIVTVNKTDQDSVLVTITSSPSEYDGKTQIHIVHTTNAKAS